MLQKLAVDIGIRAGGTDGERQAANYVRDELASWGYEAELQQFPIQTYEPGDTTLEETAPVTVTLTPLPLINSAIGHVEGEVAAVDGLGEAGDFPENVRGRIALIERGTITFTEKVQNAEDAGAIGVIVYNNAPGNEQAPLAVPNQVPAVTISQEEGQALRAAAEAGTVRVKMSVSATVSNGATSQNVVARSPGSDCRVLVGGHYDSVPAGPGANDNGSGTVVAMEMARVLATRGETAHVCFTLFGSEELGLLGSGYYVSQLSDADRKTIVAMLNFDMLAVGDDLVVLGTNTLTALAAQVANEQGVVARASSEPAGFGSDHASFLQVGVPAAFFNCFCDPRYHTIDDTIGFIQPERLTQAGGIGLEMVETLVPGS